MFCQEKICPKLNKGLKEVLGIQIKGRPEVDILPKLSKMASIPHPINFWPKIFLIPLTPIAKINDSSTVYIPYYQAD